MPPPSRGRIILAWIVVGLTVLAVWKYVDYQNQPPEVKKVISGQ